MACSTKYPTANAFLQHKCFKEASATQQREELDLFRRAIEEEFNLRPTNRRKPVHATSPRAFNESVATVVTVPLLPTSVEATQGGLSDKSMPYSTGFSVLHESNPIVNQIGASEGTYDSSPMLSHPRFALLSPAGHMLLPYVDSILTQPQPSHEWDPLNFPNQDGFSVMQ